MGQNCRDAGADIRALIQCRVADVHPRHVGDRVQRSGWQRPHDDAELARASLYCHCLRSRSEVMCAT